MTEPIDTDDIRKYPGCPACWQTVVDLCDEVDRLRRELEVSRTLHERLLAHLRMGGEE